MRLTKYKIGELVEVRRDASLAGEYYSKDGELIRLTLGHFDYQGGGFKENSSKDGLYFIGPIKQEFILGEDDIITPLTDKLLDCLVVQLKFPNLGNTYKVRI